MGGGLIRLGDMDWIVGNTIRLYEFTCNKRGIVSTEWICLSYQDLDVQKTLYMLFQAIDSMTVVVVVSLRSLSIRQHLSLDR